MMGEFSAKGNYSWHSRISTKSIKAKALLDDAAVPTGTVYQPRSAKRKHIWHRAMSSTISRAKPHLALRAMTFTQGKTQLAQAFINKEQQTESASGRHSRVGQSSISTVISKVQSYLAPRYINHDQHGESTSGTPGHDV